jgi:hypothetical protein
MSRRYAKQSVPRKLDASATMKLRPPNPQRVPPETGSEILMSFELPVIGQSRTLFDTFPGDQGRYRLKGLLRFSAHSPQWAGCRSQFSCWLRFRRPWQAPLQLRRPSRIRTCRDGPSPIQMGIAWLDICTRRHARRHVRVRRPGRRGVRAAMSAGRRMQGILRRAARLIRLRSTGSRQRRICDRPRSTNAETILQPVRIPQPIPIR